MTIDIDLTVRVAVTYNRAEDRLWTAILRDGQDILPSLTEAQRAMIYRVVLDEIAQGDQTA